MDMNKRIDDYITNALTIVEPFNNTPSPYEIRISITIDSALKSL